MQPPFPFEPFIAFGSMAIFLLIGIFLRAKIKFFQNFLIPSCLIGGAFGLIAVSTGILPFEARMFEMFAFHFFIISFISVGLTHDGDDKKEKGETKKLFKGAWWMALMEGVTISLQAIVGCAGVMLFALFGLELFPTFGLFLPLGFTEGPGQALSIGKSWEAFGFANAGTLGLTFAAIGFLFAFFIGVPLVNWGIRKGLSKRGPVELPRDLLKGIYEKGRQTEAAGHLTLHSGNVETLAFQMGLIGLVYVIGYIFVFNFNNIIGPQAAKANWGFFFFYGMLFGILVRTIMRKIGIMHMIDPGIQRRITGWAVDFLIVATIMGVQVGVVWDYIVPISTLALAAGIVTTLGVLWFGRRLDDLNLERTVTIFGTCTGTVSSGLLLLRIVDPEFKTSVAFEVGIMNILVVPIIVTSMILVNAPVWWDWSVLLTGLVHVGLLIVSLILMKASKLIGSKKF